MCPACIAAAAVTADSHTALSVIARTPKARATGDMKLPTMEIERPRKNHRKAAERSGRVAARLKTEPASAPFRWSGSGSLDASGSDTRSHTASAHRRHQLGFRRACRNGRIITAGDSAASA